MLITKNFVMLNFPKTGSSFAINTIKNIFEQRKNKLSYKILKKFGLHKKEPYLDLQLPPIGSKKFINKPYNQHGQFSQIPKEHLSKTIFTIARNPYERLISQYEFGAWKKGEVAKSEVMLTNFPHFPNLSFEDFIRYTEFLMGFAMLPKMPNANVGRQTIQFIYFYFKDPEKILNNLSDDYLDSDQYINDMANIHFLQQEKLNEGLATFLLSHGFSKKEIEPIKTKPRINITQNANPNRANYWTPSLIEYIKTKERFIFKVLKSKGIDYHPPFTSPP